MATASQDVISPITTEKPELVVSAASINSEPVELDSTPASPEKVRARRASRDELLAELDEEEKEVCSDQMGSNRNGMVDAVVADWRTYQKRKQLLLERKGDPAVLVDIPKTPGADELEKGASIVNKTFYWSDMQLEPVTSSGS